MSFLNTSPCTTQTRLPPSPPLPSLYLRLIYSWYRYPYSTSDWLILGTVTLTLHLTDWFLVPLPSLYIWLIDSWHWTASKSRRIISTRNTSHQITSQIRLTLKDEAVNSQQNQLKMVGSRHLSISTSQSFTADRKRLPQSANKYTII